MNAQMVQTEHWETRERVRTFKALRGVQNIMTMKHSKDRSFWRKEFAMLFLQMKEGDYLTIGEDITIQFFPDSKSRVRVAINAPKDLAILRGDVRERNGAERPSGLVGRFTAPPELTE